MSEAQHSTPQFLYLTTTGWKSGQPHEIEIWFVEHDGRYYIVSEHRERSHWVINIQHNPTVTFRIGKRSAVMPGTGRIIDPASQPALAEQVSALMEAKYDWSDGLIVELSPD